jgi:hypothetical protein
MKNPISELSTKAAFAWLAFSIIGPILASWGWSPFVIHTGKLMLAMSLGYMVFGLGLKRAESIAASTEKKLG